jgi:hypothetical protein
MTAPKHKAPRTVAERNAEAWRRERMRATAPVRHRSKTRTVSREQYELELDAMMLRDVLRFDLPAIDVVAAHLVAGDLAAARQAVPAISDYRARDRARRLCAILEGRA